MSQTEQRATETARIEGPWRAPLRMALFVIGFSLLGFGICFGAAWLAGAHGCRVDEGGEHPCLLFGIDFGAPVAFLGMMLVLFSFLGLPLLALVLVTCLGVAPVQFVVHGFRQGRQ